MKKRKVRLKNIIACEKAQMLPLNFTVSYVVTPIYAVICLLLAGTFGILMELDEEKYFVHGLLCLGSFAFITIVLLACVPLIRKKAINIELERYNFDTSSAEQLETYDFSTEAFSLKFDRFGMYINDELFYYNHLNKMVVTGNQHQRIWIRLQFSLSPEQVVTIPVTPTTLKMLECLEIKLDNGHILDYIAANKKDAFEQIYNKGYVVVR